MNWTCPSVVGVLLGLAVGVGAYQLPVPSLAQSVAAVFAAVLVNWRLGGGGCGS